MLAKAATLISQARTSASRLLREWLERLPPGARPRLRRAAVGAVTIPRQLGVPGFVRGKGPCAESAADVLHQSALVDTSGSTRDSRPLPRLDVAYRHGTNVTPRPIDTYTLVADARGAGWTLRNNVVVDGQRFVLTEERVRWDQLSVSRRPLERARPIPGSVAYLSNSDVANIAHWLLLTLPLVRFYEQLDPPPDRYYVGRPLRPYHLETLGALGIGPDRVVSAGVKPARVVAAIANRRHGAPEAEAMRFVIDRVAAPLLANTAPQGAGRRLFIGRGNVRFRRLLNEADVARHLEQTWGFEWVTMDGRSTAEQISLIRSAEVVVAPLGAAMTHLLWAHPGTKVVELSAPELPDPLYAEIAAVKGCRYAMIGCRPAQPDLTADLQLEANLRRRADILVDLARLDEALEALGEARR